MKERPKQTLIWGPAGSGKTVIANALRESLPGEVLILDELTVYDHKKLVRDIKKALRSTVVGEPLPGKQYDHRIVVTNEPPSEELLALVDYTIQTGIRR